MDITDIPVEQSLATDESDSHRETGPLTSLDDTICFVLAIVKNFVKEVPASWNFGSAPYADAPDFESALTNQEHRIARIAVLGLIFRLRGLPTFHAPCDLPSSCLTH